MKLTLESTNQVVTEHLTSFQDGIEYRVWEGTTESGIKVQCLIRRVAVHKDADCSQFERELKEVRPPTFEAFPCE